jgi:hypothetical protein
LAVGIHERWLGAEFCCLEADKGHYQTKTRIIFIL